MSQLIYLDTNVYLDYLYDRTSKYIPYGDFAHQLFEKSLSCQYLIVISDLVVDELNKYLSRKQVIDLIKYLRPKLKFTNVTSKDKMTSKTMNLHYPDSLHVAIANHHNAILVSHDKEMQLIGGAISAQDL